MLKLLPSFKSVYPLELALPWGEIYQKKQPPLNKCSLRSKRFRAVSEQGPREKWRE